MSILLALAACVNVDVLQKDFRETEQVIQAATNLNARECTPVEMATAEANLAFTQVEFQEGDTRRAREHLDIAMANGKIALDTAPSCIPVDSDGDGILDTQDLCVDEPEDFDGREDHDGCPDITGDSDGDGLDDDTDQCPAEAEDKDGFQDSDGCPDPDNDQDGVLDASDQCASQPEDLDGFEDQDGCPDRDNDQDGVPDTADACPNTAGPENGCPIADKDGDGFVDTMDACPTEPGVAPDGCPLADFDKDGLPDEQDQCPGAAGPRPTGCPDADMDGVFDPQDQCPTTPGLKPHGCPDTDGDGIVDQVDKCPAQPENFNQYLDTDGCPDAPPQKVKITGRQIVIEEKIQFETGKAIIRPASYEILDSVVQVMQDYPQITVRIEGHTDSDGSEAANQRLSKDRADAVFEYMVAHGIEASRLHTEGYGETRPIDTNRTPDGKANNRRVEFHIESGLDD
ncbi:MAG: OmpA family protein [Myxococcota bacterium]|nr:OmpA family protein [Myxococcota bacterium]